MKLQYRNKFSMQHVKLKCMAESVVSIASVISNLTFVTAACQLETHK